MEYNSWEITNNIPLQNTNLQNTLRKVRKYRIDTRKHTLQLAQNLSESTLGVDIPVFLLDLWGSHFRDSTNALIEIFTIIKSERINGENFNNDTEFLVTAIGALINRLNEYGDFFDKYTKSTKSFANRDEKTKKSIMKEYDDLRFIPVNLHLEQLQVESKYDGEPNSKKATYDFTSVGAFTTVHVTKPQRAENSVELLMQAESITDLPNQINNETTLVFYSLKILIYILNDLVVIRGTDDKIQPILRCSKNLDIISRVLIPSHETLKIRKLDTVARSNLTRSSLVEKFKYLKIKFEELNLKVKQTEFQNLDDFLYRITEPLVELYNLIFTESISERIEFINSCAVLSHSLSTFIASLDLKYMKNTEVSDQELEALFKFHVKNGILFQVESMLNCSSNEGEMLFDHHLAIQSLNKVHVHFPMDYASFKATQESIFIVIRSDGYHVYFYSNIQAASKSIPVVPIMFNVGINEQAVSSYFLGNNLLQKYINSKSIIELRKYYDVVRNDIEDMEVKFKVDTLIKRLETKRSFIEDSRPIELLHNVAEITRLIGGFRVTNCKSGKDRTGVSVSLEQGFILVREHNLDSGLQQYVLDDLRRNGTRIDVIKKSIGQGSYAFNKIRYFLLPQLYQPPLDLCGDYKT